MKLVLLESPYAGDVERNLSYARACMKDCLARDEAPFASHCLYTQPGVLDDLKPEERRLGIQAGFEWGRWSDMVVFCIDLGWSNGMKGGLAAAEMRGADIRVRTLGAPWSDLAPSDAVMERPAPTRREGRPA